MKLSNDECEKILSKSSPIALADLDATYEMYGSAVSAIVAIFFYRKEDKLFYRKVM